MERDRNQNGASDFYSASQEHSRRVRHMLAVIRSIIVRSAESGSNELRDYAAHLDGRIGAFARTQQSMLLHPDEGLDLQNLIREELLSAAVREDEQFTIDGPDVVLSAETTEVLTLAFHELVTNALKYGAFSVPDGKLEISWTMDESQVRLIWREQGVVDAERRFDGFGLEIVERQTPYQIGGDVQLQFTSEGLVCSLSFPIEARSVEGRA